MTESKPPQTPNTTILYTVQQLLNDISQNGAEFKRLKDELASNFAFYPEELVAGGGIKGRSFDTILADLQALHKKEARQIHLRNVCNMEFTVTYQGEGLNVLQILKRIQSNKSILSALDTVRKRFPGKVDTSTGRRSLWSSDTLNVKEIDLEKKKLVFPQTKISEMAFDALYSKMNQEVKELNALKNYLNGRIVVPRDLNPAHLDITQEV